MLGVGLEIARDHRYPCRRDRFRRFHRAPDRAADLLDLAERGWRLDHFERLVGGRRDVRGFDEQMLEHETEASKAPAAAHEVGQHFVRDRLFRDETIPGQFGETRRTGWMPGGLDSERRVSDDPDERRDDHELEQAEVVDFGDLQLPHAVEQRRARAAPLQREQLLEHHAFAVVAVAEAALGEQALVALEDVGQADDASADACAVRAVFRGQRARRGAQVGRGERRALELAD